MAVVKSDERVIQDWTGDTQWGPGQKGLYVQSLRGLDIVLLSPRQCLLLDNVYP